MVIQGPEVPSIQPSEPLVQSSSCFSSYDGKKNGAIGAIDYQAQV